MTRQLVVDSRRPEGSMELTPAIREYLLYGTGRTHEETMKMKYDLGPVRRYPQHLDLIWKANREELISEFRTDNQHGMPHAWWTWSAPERRNVVSGNKFLIFHKAWDADLPGGRGLPNAFRDDPEECDNAPVFESETAYLKRLGLW